MNIGFVGISCRRVHPDAYPLRRGSSQAAATDVAYVGTQQLDIYPGCVAKLPTGWAFAVPDNVGMLILPRSGLSTKSGLRPANTPGLLDPDYRGELFVALENFSNEIRCVSPGDYIAQLMFTPFYKPLFQVENVLQETERGDGGFGSTEERGRG
ncbi:dUTP diphosphatase [Marinobacter nauticus]|uniref:dUTP diphosphatase n=1 Tax=Marinobacter nauticus TaxID=2743 RepID=A0A833JS10_MARNT|nr:dUTP diphosphatase [Marinobacter nauticus]KAE8546168.1 Deoxyuridine 5'-triphosphate nucleotidohydrolase [Marinobacter nauticus]